MPPPLRDDRAVAHDHEAVQVGALDRVEEVEHPPRQDTLLVRRAPGQAASGHGRSLNGLRPGPRAGRLPTAHDDFDPHHPGRAEPVVAGVVWPAPDTMLASILSLIHISEPTRRTPI